MFCLELPAKCVAKKKSWYHDMNCNGRVLFRVLFIERGYTPELGMRNFPWYCCGNCRLSHLGMRGKNSVLLLCWLPNNYWWHPTVPTTWRTYIGIWFITITLTSLLSQRLMSTYDCFLRITRSTTQKSSDLPGVVLFNGCEEGTGDVVVLMLCPTVKLCKESGTA